MKLVVTVDVEEDQWGITPPRSATVRNVRRLPILQKLLNEFGIVPTYLLTYPVVTDSDAGAILRPILAAGECEIGAHCHPWTTPPYDEDLNKYNSMLCNLSPALQFAKLQRLHEAFDDQFHKPRWHFVAVVGDSMRKLRRTSSDLAIVLTHPLHRIPLGHNRLVRTFRMSLLSPLRLRRGLLVLRAQGVPLWRFRSALATYMASFRSVRS